METTTRPHEKDKNLSPMNSPESNGSCSNSNTGPLQVPAALIQTPPLTPKTISSRSEISNPYPTTFVQADATRFKHVVQMLTGSSETAKKQQQVHDQTPSDLPSSRSSIPPIKPVHQKKQGFRLYERRNSLKNGLMISPILPSSVLNSGGFSPRKPEIMSPSLLDFPSLALSSPVTPLHEEDPFDRSSSPSIGSSSSEEDKAIAEKKFYFHPSPRTSSRYAEPRLLPLFPVTSPRVSGSSS